MFRLLGEKPIYYFLSLGVINSVKSPYKKNYSPENVCMEDLFFEYNYGANFLDNPHSKQDPKPLRQRRS